ncbi:hypothetical protein G6M89_09225 [Natronolimnobius sp. AArcel1]|uniref:hypothetical protein n=1 Tax=Natronolimnobius sp. AArcel1 TaxID=1679093 RepID=UPI0013EB05BD|nr:hypothetical protein [Natronolimnobius sp. AArcel1]NGM69185.1 hypothetical protein [Natronolimnobius sp. AArcel1]
MAEKETHLTIAIHGDTVYHWEEGPFGAESTSLGMDGDVASVQQAESDFVYAAGEDDSGDFLAKYEKTEGIDEPDLDELWRIHGVEGDAHIGFCDTADPVLATDGSLSRYSADDGSHQWTVDPGSSVNGVATSKSRNVIVAVGDAIKEFEDSGGSLVNEISTVDTPSSVTRDDEDNYVVYHSDGILRKYDRDGDVLWENDSVTDGERAWRDDQARYYIGSHDTFGGPAAIVDDNGEEEAYESWPFSSGCSTDFMPKLHNGENRGVLVDDDNDIKSLDDSMSTQWEDDVGAIGSPYGIQTWSTHPRFCAFAETWGVEEEVPDDGGEVVGSANVVTSTSGFTDPDVTAISSSEATYTSGQVGLNLPESTGTATPSTSILTAESDVTTAVASRRAQATSSPITSNSKLTDVSATSTTTSVGEFATATSTTDRAHGSATALASGSTVVSSARTTVPERIVTVEGLENTAATTTLSNIEGSTHVEASSDTLEASGRPLNPSTLYESPVPESRYRFTVSSSINKFDSDGDLKWQESLEYRPWDSAVDSDGNIYFTDGSANVVVSYDSEGNRQWVGEYDPMDRPIAVDDLGGVFITNYNGYINKLDRDGDREFFSERNEGGRPVGVEPDGDGGVYMTAESSSMSDASIARFNSSGDITVERTFEDKSELSYPVRESGTQDVTFIADGEFIKFDGDSWGGTILDSDQVFGTDDEVVDLLADSDDDLYVAVEFDDSDDYTLAKYNWDSGIIWEETVSYSINSIDITEHGNLYVVDSTNDEIKNYNPDDGSLQWTSDWDHGGDLLAYPNYPANSDGWVSVTIAGGQARHATASSNTLESEADGIASPEAGGVTATASTPTPTGSTGVVSTGGTTTATASPVAPSIEASAESTATFTSGFTSTLTGAGVKRVTATGNPVNVQASMFVPFTRTDEVHANMITVSGTPSQAQAHATQTIEADTVNVTTSISDAEGFASSSSDSSIVTASAAFTTIAAWQSITCEANIVTANADPTTIDSTSIATPERAYTLTATTTPYEAIGETYISIESEDLTTVGSLNTPDVFTYTSGYATLTTASASLTDVHGGRFIGGTAEPVTATSSLSEPTAETWVNLAASTTTASADPSTPSVETQTEAMGALVEADGVPLVVDSNGITHVAAKKYSASAILNTGLSFSPRISRVSTTDNWVTMNPGKNSADLDDDGTNEVEMREYQSSDED